MAIIGIIAFIIIVGSIILGIGETIQNISRIVDNSQDKIRKWQAEPRKKRISLFLDYSPRVVTESMKNTAIANSYFVPFDVIDGKIKINTRLIVAIADGGVIDFYYNKIIIQLSGYKNIDLHIDSKTKKSFKVQELQYITYDGTFKYDEIHDSLPAYLKFRFREEYGNMYITIKCQGVEFDVAVFHK